MKTKKIILFMIIFIPLFKIVGNHPPRAAQQAPKDDTELATTSANTRLQQALKCNDAEYWKYGRNDIEQVIKDGADPNMKSWNSSTPLAMSTLHSDAKMVSFLLSNGADPDLKQDYNNQEPIFYAKTLEIALLYKTHRANFNVLNNFGGNLIHQAMGERYEATLVPFYFDHGVDPDLTNTYGQTPLIILAIFCTSHSKEELRKKAEFLLSKNIRLDARFKGKTALEIAQTMYENHQLSKLFVSMIKDEMIRRIQMK